VPCVNGDLTVNNNLIKTSVKPENLGVDGDKSPKIKEEKTKSAQDKKPKPQDVSIEKTEVVETIVKPIEKTFDKKEVVSGFEEAKLQIKDLYDTIFSYGDNFKPTYQDTLGDLLSYLGGLAYKLGAEKSFSEVFGINVNTLNDRYYSVSYIPYAIKIAVWAYKNKGKNNVLTILNGIVRCAYAFAYKLNENDIEDRVYKTVLSVIEFIESNDISLN
jgi:hypothetical protein